MAALFFPKLPCFLLLTETWFVLTGFCKSVLSPSNPFKDDAQVYMSLWVFIFFFFLFCFHSFILDTVCCAVRRTSDLWSSCLCLPNAGIKITCYHTQLGLCFFFFIFKRYVYIHLWVCKHECRCLQGQMKVSYPLYLLELHTVVSYPVWALGTEGKSSKKKKSSLKF